MLSVCKSGSLGLGLFILLKTATLIASVDIFLIQTCLTVLLDLIHDEFHKIHCKGVWKKNHAFKATFFLLAFKFHEIWSYFSLCFKLLLLLNFYRRKVYSPVTEVQGLCTQCSCNSSKHHFFKISIWLTAKHLPATAVH